MEKVKVIEFIQSVGDGGAETLVKDYARLINKDAFEVTVVVLHEVKDSANLQRLKESGIQVIALSAQDDKLKNLWRKVFWKKPEQDIRSEDVQEKPVLPGETYEETGILRWCRNYVRNLFFGVKFLRVVRQTKATVVHAHLDMLSCLQTVSIFLKKVKLFHTCHALPHLIYAGEEGKAARHLIQNNNLQLIALHAAMAEEMDTMFPGHKTKVIRNGVNIAQFQDPGVSREEKRRELAIPADAYVIGHVGRFTPEKNHSFLVEVFREIAVRKENAFLLIIGAGSTDQTRQKLKEYGLENKYCILSHRQDIPELLSAMDVFVFPSIFEGFGIALLEAQAAGLRCVASDRCPEEVFRSESCVSLPLEDPFLWAEAALDPSRKQECSKDLMDYNMNREIRRLERLYMGQLD